MIGLLLASALSLDGAWGLSYFRQPEEGALRTLPIPASIEVKEVAATVPGNCELDLVRACLAPNPEIGTNSYAFRKWEGYQWLYTKTFTFHSAPTPSLYTYHIVFEGVDTFADIFLNGKKIGECANMLIPHRFDVTEKLRAGENTVQVLIRSAFMETRDKTLGELGRTMTPGSEGELIRKAAHMGGWDIFPRLFASGLWRGVSLVTESRTQIDQTSYFVSAVDVANRQAKVSARFRVRAPFDEIDRAKVRMTLSRNGRTAYTSEKNLRHYHNELRFALSLGTRAHQIFGLSPGAVFPRGQSRGQADFRVGIEIQSNDQLHLVRGHRRGDSEQRWQTADGETGHPPAGGSFRLCRGV